MTSRIKYNDPQKTQALGLPYHYEMVSDKKRVTPFKKAIQKVCKGKRVLESGTGSAILSILAAKAGAKKVYAIELDPDVYHFAKQNIKKSGYGKIIKLLNKDVMKVKLSELDNEKVDVVIAENLSTWEVTEPQIPIMNYINKNLAKKDAKKLPSTLFNYLELTQTQYRFENVITLKTCYFGFTGVKKPTPLSGKVLFNTVNLKKYNSLKVDKTIKIKVKKTGTLNSFRLTSPLQVYGKINFTSSDSLMPPVIIPLEKKLKVKKGDLVKVRIQYNYNTDWDKVKCKVEIK